MDRRFAGIEVDRDSLRLAIHSGGQKGELPNTLEGRTALITRLQKGQSLCVVVEACGGMECAWIGSLAQAGNPVTVVNPRQVRDFAPEPRDGWPRQMPWTPRSWRSSRKG